MARTIDLVNLATRCLSSVTTVVATDDTRIARLANENGCEAAMTDSALSSGSARVLAAALQHDPLPRFVINVQGDSPFLPPDAIIRAIEALAAGALVVTPATRLSWDELDALRLHKQTASFSGTTCAVGPDGNALWFSKQIIPALRDEASLRARPLSPVLRHLGLYGYTLESLVRFEDSPVGFYEDLEGLEQLRFLEAGIPVRVVEVDRPRIAMGGIDSPADVDLAEQLIARYGDPISSPS